ncbi:chromate transporter [Acidovorax temperans]|uniref:chromate transporter n=1 Tax=Acidovorax temperans TaxID=80878 RepID=UPI0035B0F0FD
MDIISSLSLVDWIDLFIQFSLLSLLAVGGAITTAPDMNRYLVIEQGWINSQQFSASIALSQAAPGPNVLFVALLGWNIGLNAGGGVENGWTAWGLALFGAVVVIMASVLPSSVFTYIAMRWASKNRDMRIIRAFKMGMAPIVISLFVSTGWLLTVAHDEPSRDWPIWILTVGIIFLTCYTKIHPWWLILVGACMGGLGLV